MATNEPLPTPWEFESEEQKKKMLEPITQENAWVKLKLIRDVSGMSRKDLASTLGVAESTIFRLETRKTEPKTEFMLRLSALAAIGHAKYSKLSEEEKEKISEFIGTTGGLAAGVGGALAAVSVSGVAGLSAAGVTSGLAAIGGGTMLGGLAVVAVIPAVVGLAGFGLVKGIKAICEANRLNCKEVDNHWEIVPMDPSADDINSGL